MTGISAVNDTQGDGASRGVLRVIRAAMSLPGARVNRESFLRSQLRPHCTPHQVEKAIKLRPGDAGIRRRRIDRIADSVIRSHVVKASGLSFAAGLPGGWFMAATIPADVTQSAWHAIVVAQKLAYLYGWPDLLEEGDLDEETELRIVLLIGAMLGAEGANKLLAEIAARFAREAGRRIPRYALTKTAYYPLIKTILKWIGIKLTKQTFGRGVGKVIPIVGGVISAGVTAFTLRPMARRLKNHLRELEYAVPPDPDICAIEARAS